MALSLRAPSSSQCATCAPLIRGMAEEPVLDFALEPGQPKSL